MAVTFEEVESFARGTGDPVRALTVPTTIVVTQEDGRTSYCLTEGHFFDWQQNELSAGAINGVVSESHQYFNDRVGPGHGPVVGAIPSSSEYFNHRDTDLLRFQFQRTAPGKFALKIQVPRWGLAVQVPMLKAASAKLYVGYGTQIGAVVGQPLQALYAVSFLKVASLFGVHR